MQHPLPLPARLLMCDMTSNPRADSLPRPPARRAQPMIKWESGVHCCPNELIHLPALRPLTQNSTPPFVLLLGLSLSRQIVYSLFKSHFRKPQLNQFGK